jgi:PhnB protein
MAALCPWINFNGNAEEAFTFYKSVFGGEFSNVTRFKDVMGPGQAAEEADKVMRIALPIGNGSMLIGNDVPQSMGTVSEHENRSKIHVAAESKEEAGRLFNGLSARGQVEVPPEDGSETHFSMFRDRYGIEWIVESNPGNEHLANPA